jgi:predicted extracellular nuclease
VNVVGAWAVLTCSVSGAKTVVVSGGPTTFTLDPDSDFASSEACTLAVIAANVSDQDTDDPPDEMAADFLTSFTAANLCTLPYTRVYSIQGSGATVAITGEVTTQGVVVGDYEGASPALRGFFIQDQLGDGNPATSDGIFVFNGSNSNMVSLGQVVRVTGIAGENQGQSQISAANIRMCDVGTVDPTEVTFPVPDNTYLERYEGMLVRLPQTMYVTEHFQLGRFGQVILSSGDRLQQPTDVTLPGAPALALQAANDLNRIIVDDALQSQNPDPIVLARGGLPLSASNTLRGGDTATGIVGVMTYTWGGNSASPNAYRVRPINALNGFVNFEAVNSRPAPVPEVGGTVRVASANLLNYFNTFDGLPDVTDNCTVGVGGAATDCRGADTPAEFARQWPKTVATLLSTGADVLGLTEFENDGYGPTSAIADLTDRLNAATAPGTWAFIDADANAGQLNALGTDAIKVGILYKPAKVTPAGQTAALNSVAFVNGGDGSPRNRPSLAQAFELANGGRFVLVMNHFKSRGSACDIPDAADGQGNCNVVRANAAAELLSWLGTDPTTTGTAKVLLLGDFNAYAMEDPIELIKSAGYASLVDTFLGPDAYTYVFDGQWGSLDHALASPGLAGYVTGTAVHHVNADEPSVLDYNTDFKTSNLIATLYAPDEFRMADHDPVVVGLEITAAPEVSAGGPYTVINGQTVLLKATGADPDGTPLTFAWDLDNDGTFETPGQNVVYEALNGVGVFTVTVKATDGHGDSSTASTTVTVVFNWTGFSPPVMSYPAVNAAKAGSAVPVKFGLGGDQGLAVLATGFPVSVPVDCSTGAPGAGSPTANPGGSILSYDPSNGQYTYVWKTKKSWAGTCRLLSVMLVDGTTYEAYFSFK